MAPLYDGHDYYRKMFELQEKLRKSEEERIRLEERFAVLVRESRSRHDACINRLRVRYIQYLEEQRTRDERNHKLLAALDKVLNRLALISAKKDRLNVLRKQYEAYLLRAYANRRPAGSVTGDSGIASQNEDRNSKKTITRPDLVSAESASVFSPSLQRSSVQSHQPRSHLTSKVHPRSDNGGGLNNPATSPDIPLDVDHRRANSPLIGQSGQFAQVPSILTHRADQYRRDTTGGAGEIPSLCASCSAAPVLSTANAQPVDRFFVEAPVESVQSELPCSLASQRFDSLTFAQPFRYPPPVNAARRYDASVAAEYASTMVVDPRGAPRRQIGSLAGYLDPEDEGSVRSLTSDDVDDLIKRNVSWRSADGARTPRGLSAVLRMGNGNFDESDRMTAILEGELDRYIDNIRQFHRAHGGRSLEELDHEQNTSGDLLNVSLSEDAAELPAEDRARKDRMPEEIERILALASDLASATTTNGKGIAHPAENGGPIADAGPEDEIRRTAELGSGYDTFRNESEKREESAFTRDEIRDVATRKTQLDPTDAKIVREKRNDANDSLEWRTKEDSAKEDESSDEKIFYKGEQFEIVTGQESDIEASFDVVQELQPWNLTDVRTKVQVLQLDETVDGGNRMAEDQGEMAEAAVKIVDEGSDDSSEVVERGNAADKAESIDTRRDPPAQLRKTEMEKLDSNKSEHRRESETSLHIVEAELAPSEILNEGTVDFAASRTVEKPNEGDRKSEEPESSQREEKAEGRVDELNESSEDGKGYSAEESEYPTDQAGRYVRDPNERYRFEQNVSYEETVNEEYEGYGDQGYAQESQEYVEYLADQYGQYEQVLDNQQYQDPDARYQQQDFANQGYQQDPNQGYQQDPNQEYQQDPNQGYDYGYDQQYDPNQGYEQDPNQGYEQDPNQGYEQDPNQAYAYAKNVPYDQSQTYDNAYEQEYGERQRDPDDRIVDVESAEERLVTEKSSAGRADPESEHRSDKDEDVPHQANDVSPQGRSGKKDVIKSLLDSDTDTTIERNVSNTESDFDFN